MTELPGQNHYLSQWAELGYSQSNQDKQKPGWRLQMSESEEPSASSGLGTPALGLTFQRKESKIHLPCYWVLEKVSGTISLMLHVICISSFMLRPSSYLLNTMENRCYWFLLTPSCRNTETVSVRKHCFWPKVSWVITKEFVQFHSNKIPQYIISSTKPPMKASWELSISVFFSRFPPSSYLIDNLESLKAPTSVLNMSIQFHFLKWKMKIRKGKKKDSRMTLALQMEGRSYKWREVSRL